MLTILISCASSEDKKTIEELKGQVDKLLAENENLRESLKKYEDKEVKAIKAEKERSEKLEKKLHKDLFWTTEFK